MSSSSISPINNGLFSSALPDYGERSSRYTGNSRKTKPPYRPPARHPSPLHPWRVFEQLDDFLKEDYTQWCTNALEGAYDWVDPLLFSTDAPVLSNDVGISVKEQEPEEVGATEEQLLQKLAEEPEDEADDAWQTATLKREAISLQPLQPDEREQELIVELSETGIETNEVAPVYNEFVPTAEEAFSEPETQSVAEEYIAPEETSQYEVNEVKEQPELHEFPANEAAVPITE